MSERAVNPFQELRKHNMNLIRKMLDSIGEVEYSKFIAIIKVNTGVSDKTARDYIQTLRNAGYIKVSKGAVSSPPPSPSVSPSTHENKIKNKTPPFKSQRGREMSLH